MDCVLESGTSGLVRTYRLLLVSIGISTCYVESVGGFERGCELMIPEVTLGDGCL